MYYKAYGTYRIRCVTMRVPRMKEGNISIVL